MRNDISVTALQKLMFNVWFVEFCLICWKCAFFGYIWYILLNKDARKMGVIYLQSWKRAFWINHNDFVATPSLWHTMFLLMCMSCYKAIGEKLSVYTIVFMILWLHVYIYIYIYIYIIYIYIDGYINKQLNFKNSYFYIRPPMIAYSFVRKPVLTLCLKAPICPANWFRICSKITWSSYAPYTINFQRFENITD